MLNEKILSDTCEALIGALYLDQGFKTSEDFILKNWHTFGKSSSVTKMTKKKLQEYSLKNIKLPTYKAYKQTGPNHNPLFKIQVQIPNSKAFIGYGKSKKLAEQNAAYKLIKTINII